MDRRSLTYRILTAVVGIPLLLGAAWLGGWWWGGVSLVLLVIAATEYSRLQVGFSLSWRYLLILGVFLLLTMRFVPQPYLTSLLASLTAVAFVAAYLPPVLTGDPLRRDSSRRPSDGLAVGILYLGLAGVALTSWRLDFGFSSLVWFFVIIWVNDIAAYFAGHGVGWHKLAPRLSPAKSWEGAIAGLIAGVIVSTGFARYLPVSALWLAVSGALVIIAAQVGDLFESALKRRVGVKDSGVILPGHGGILDRFDGVIVAAPVGYVLISLWAS